MLKKINNKGYMLVEIILAFSIAFILLYFIMDLVIKMKNKNDDLLVKTLVYTDQTIVSNGLMKLAINNKDEFDCDKLEVDGNVIKYDSDVIDIVSDYAEVGEKTCSISKNRIVVNIPISVKQLSDEDFSINIDYRYGEVGVTYLYNVGTISDLLGGFYASTNLNTGCNASQNGSVTFNTNNMVAKAEYVANEGQAVGFIVAKNKIDVTNYNKLYIKTSYTSNNSYLKAIIGLFDGTRFPPNGCGSNSIATTTITSTTSTKLYSIDVSSISGSYVLGFYIGDLNSSASASLTISEIYLEK